MGPEIRCFLFCGPHSLLEPTKISEVAAAEQEHHAFQNQHPIFYVQTPQFAILLTYISLYSIKLILTHKQAGVT